MSLDVVPHFKIVASVLPWSQACREFSAPVGHTVADALEAIQPYPLDVLSAHVFVGANEIPREMWESVRPNANAVVYAKVMPLGGGKKNPLATILSIALIAASWGAGSFVAASMGKIAGAIASGVVSGVGNLLIAAIAPPPSQDNRPVNNPTESPTLFIEGARNDLRFYEPVPVVLGFHKHVPPLGATNYTETSGDKQFCRQLFIWSMGKITLTNKAIGATALTEYQNYQMEDYLNGEGSDVVSDLYPFAVYQEGSAIQLSNPDDEETEDDDEIPGAWTLRTSAPDANELIMDISCIKGLFKYNNAGKRIPYTVNVEYRYSVTGMNDWSDIVRKEITNSTTSALRTEIRITGLDPVIYDVQMRRVEKDSNSDKIFDETWWTALRTVTYENPLNLKYVSFSTLRMQATDQLNGTVDQLSGDIKSIVMDWDADTQNWVERVSNNPAALFRYVLQNAPWFADSVEAPNASPLADDRMDLDTLQDWHDYCVEQGFEYNKIIDYSISVWELVKEIAAAGRASPTLVDGKWSVVVDKEQDLIAQHFTAANTWGFQGSITYPEVPHALRVQFLNEERGFIEDEYLVYDDGYNEKGTEGKASATKIQTLTLPGITKPSLIWKLAREHMAVIRLRPREISFYTTFQYSIASKGRLIKFAHPVPLIGGEQGYIKEVFLNGDDEVYAVRLDREVEMSANHFYRMRWRSTTTNGSHIKDVVTVSGSIDTISFVTPFSLAADDIAEDDLFMFGIRDYETIDLIIRDIIPDGNLNAKLVCLDYNPAIYQASQGTIPAFESRITIPASMQRPLPPVVERVQTGIEAQIRNIDGSFSSRMIITLENQNSFDVMPIVKVRLSGTETYSYAHVVTATAERVVIEGLEESTRYDLQLFYRKVLNSDMTGAGSAVFSAPVSVNAVLFEGRNDLPPDITNPELQIFGEIMILRFDALDILDLKHYEVRYSPNTVGVAWSTAAVVRTGFTANEVVVAAVSGTFLIKAFDLGGRESRTATPISASIVQEGYNAVETITQHDTFPGTHNNTKVVGGRLELDDVTAGEGIYYFDDYIDLGEVFTSRVIPHIVVGGRNLSNAMSSWPSLRLLRSLGGADPSTWTATLEESHTEDDPAASGGLEDDNGDALTDDDGNPLTDDSGAGVATWTNYAPISIGMQTFRAQRYRLRITGNGTNVTPSVEELSVLVDMPDRTIDGSNVTIPEGGYSLTYDPPFHTKPSFVPVLLDQEEGDVVTITAESKTGATITVTNGGLDVERHMNFHVRGYGREQ